jgi:hypothetical protein
MRSPHPGLAHGPVGGPPFPVAAAQVFARLQQHRPDAVEDPQAHPPPEGAVDQAVVRELARETVPLAAAAEAEDDRVQRPARVDPPSAGLLRRVKLS